MQIVASLPGDWDHGKAASITNDILARNPDLVAIFAANDGIALVPSRRSMPLARASR